MEVAAVMSMSDKLLMIDTGTEIVNKLMVCFQIDSDLSGQIDQELNVRYRELKPDSDSINRLFFLLMALIRRIDGKARDWVQRYPEN